MRELNLQQVKIIELGCHDGKTLEFLDTEPKQYVGLDANWEGGLDLGRLKWKDRPHVTFQQCVKPDDITIPETPHDVGICMETLEHIPPDLVGPYLKTLSAAIDGYLFITVPIERGAVFLIKHGLKKILRMQDVPFDTIETAEFLNSVMGRLDRVKRYQHKGFDDRLLVKQVNEYFDVLNVSGIFPGLPLLSLNLTIGIVAKTKSLR
ncbi:MAG: hypothetical protein ABI856_13450 [Nitrospira sp.]